MTASVTTKRSVRIGTRGSRLARWQAGWVAAQLRRLNPELLIELVEIKTHGDRDRNSPLATIGGVGVFTKEIQRAVCDGLVDIAVHSLKDLPTQSPEELLLAAVPAREDVADALIAPKHLTIKGLPQAAHIGTSSPRRRAQLLSLRPDLEVVTIRGNVDTRVKQALDGRVDAVMLAWAGLQRLGLEQHVTQRLDPSEFLPAVGQGALGIECRRDDAATLALVKLLDEPSTHRAVLAERTMLATLEGGCTLPMAAWAREVEGDESIPGVLPLAISAALFDPDGRARMGVTLHGPGDDPIGLGQRAAQVLLNQGGVALLGRSSSSNSRSALLN
jgi:hydroxymethylbilane synthase